MRLFIEMRGWRLELSNEPEQAVHVTEVGSDAMPVLEDADEGWQFGMSGGRR